MTDEQAKTIAAQVWCRPECAQIVMDTTLANAFAQVLQEQIAELETVAKDTYAYLSRVPATYENGTLLGRLGHALAATTVEREG